MNTEDNTNSTAAGASPSGKDIDSTAKATKTPPTSGKDTDPTVKATETPPASGKDTDPTVKATETPPTSGKDTDSTVKATKPPSTSGKGPGTSSGTDTKKLLFSFLDGAAILAALAVFGQLWAFFYQKGILANEGLKSTSLVDVSTEAVFSVLGESWYFVIALAFFLFAINWLASIHWGWGLFITILGLGLTVVALMSDKSTLFELIVALGIIVYGVLYILFNLLPAIDNHGRLARAILLLIPLLLSAYLGEYAAKILPHSAVQYKDSNQLWDVVMIYGNTAVLKHENDYKMLPRDELKEGSFSLKPADKTKK